MSATPGTRRLSEEWEDWMDWDKTADDSAEEETEKHLRRSVNGAYQLPSPGTSTTSDPPPSEFSRKRKASTEKVESSPIAKRQGQDGAQTSVQNKSHSIVEKRYRTNLNQKIANLGNCLPSLRGDGKAKEDVEKPESTLKHNKATVLTEAILYIRYLERRNAHLEQANTALQEQSRKMMSKRIPVQEEVKVEETRSSSSDHSESRSSPVEDEGEDEEALSKPVQGMIKVPQEWRRLWRGELRPYSAEPELTLKNKVEDGARVSIRGGQYAGRLMVGSLAGLMVMDGFAITQKEKSDERGLFALPLLRHLPDLASLRFEPCLSAPDAFWSSFPRSQFLAPFLKGFLVFGVLGLMLFVYLFNSKPPPRKPSFTPVPQPAPSVASPLDVRQRAWLTSIQTVWVPRHHVLPEMLALNVETAAYLIRHLLGWHMYSWLTGRTEHEEIARVRAWDIALDAQLSGGDPEISKSRLVLTLWASGTLPSTPARLMLKALHIRVLFWQPSRMPWLTRLLHKAAGKLARWQWTKAYRMQRKLEAAKAVEPEPLSEHLKALLLLSSDEVMTDSIMQRAHNLVWNTSIFEGAEVMEDTAMRGPLDALASWLSSLRLTVTLKGAMASDRIVQDSCVLHQLDVATATAPPGSLAKAKALAAKAVLCDTGRNSHVLQLIQALAPSPLKEESWVENMSSTLMSLVAELSGTDGNDIAASGRYALAMDMLQHSECNTGAASQALQLLDTSRIAATSLGLLGITAARQLCLVLRQREKTANIPTIVGALNAQVWSLIRSLDESTALRQMTPDTQTRDLIASTFQRISTDE
ncbi:MAG: hypothetical protein Q9217_006635 [Psora testacea]